MSAEQIACDELVRKALNSWTSGDTALLVEALNASSTAQGSSHEGGGLDLVLPPAQQAAYARYVFSSGRQRRECADPYPFLKEWAEKDLRGRTVLISSQPH